MDLYGDRSIVQGRYIWADRARYEADNFLHCHVLDEAVRHGPAQAHHGDPVCDPDQVLHVVSDNDDADPVVPQS